MSSNRSVLMALYTWHSTPLYAVDMLKIIQQIQQIQQTQQKIKRCKRCKQIQQMQGLKIFVTNP
jgi:hypothetical protein